MGHVFNAGDAQNYEKWLSSERNRSLLGLETGLMQSLLRPVFGESLLDVGCGTGESIRPYLGKGISLTGIDPSAPMLEIAREKLDHRVDFFRGYAEDLPFGDNEFNHVSLFLTLEFVDDPDRAVAEACRVAKDSVFFGILNRHSVYVTRLRVHRFFASSVYNHARFFSIGDIRRTVFAHIGRVPLFWKTVLQFPGSSRRLLHGIESAGYLAKCPFGAFAGIKTIPVPRLQAVPMALATRVGKSAAGNRVASCSNYKQEKNKNSSREAG